MAPNCRVAADFPQADRFSVCANAVAVVMGSPKAVSEGLLTE
jgi:hypothetical protein